MLETVITLLIYLCVLALVVYLIIWVLGEIGLALPPQVIKILWVIVALVAILLIVRALLPGGTFKFGKIGVTPLQVAEQSVKS
jgi:bacteriorhodopsin